MPGALVSRCPVCLVASIHTNGRTACSLMCATHVVGEIHEEYGIPLERALELVSRKAMQLGLPDVPSPDDKHTHKYVFVCKSKTEDYWKLDREILETGVNVEYMWDTDPRSRIYRFHARSIGRLPETMQEYKAQSFDAIDLVLLYGPEIEVDGRTKITSPYWHFLEAEDKP